MAFLLPFKSSEANLLKTRSKIKVNHYAIGYLSFTNFILYPTKIMNSMKNKHTFLKTIPFGLVFNNSLGSHTVSRRLLRVVELIDKSY